MSVPSIVTPNAKCCLHLVREGAERYNTKARVFSCRPAFPYMSIYICTCRSEGLSSALCSIHNPPSLRPGGYRGHGTQGSPGGYRSHGTQGNQLSSRRACPSPHAAVPREAAAVEGVPLEFRTSSPLHSSGSLAHSFTRRFQLVECSSTSASDLLLYPTVAGMPSLKCCVPLRVRGL